MLKTGFTFGIITLVIIAGGVFLLTRNDSEHESVSKNLPDYHQYFWSETCPHCDNVNDFMDTWEQSEFFEVEKIEVNESSEKTQLFFESGTQICKTPANRLGVPLLITPEGECFSGDTPIIEYLKKLEL